MSENTNFGPDARFATVRAHAEKVAETEQRPSVIIEAHKETAWGRRHQPGDLWVIGELLDLDMIEAAGADEWARRNGYTKCDVWHWVEPA